mmetsp:Transcript_21554/g.18575  ORF Transcript_21554/g.18575 Transcript_21554/m.18575 type:complete len:152 (+) Transcript_21554:451-906(+)
MFYTNYTADPDLMIPMNNETFFDNISTSSFNNITFFVKLNDEIGQTVLDFGQKYLYFLISDEDSKVSNSYTSASCNNTWCNFTNEKTKIAGRPFTNVTFDMVYRSTSIPDIEFFFGGKLRECQAGEYNNTDLEVCTQCGYGYYSVWPNNTC